MTPRVCVVVLAVAFLAAGGSASAQTTWNLTGDWRGSAGNLMQLRQSGTTVTWFARSPDTKAWAHDFTGAISGNSISGTFQDRSGYRVHNRGVITARIIDDCHLVITGVGVNGGSPTGGGEQFTKTPCAAESTVWPPRPDALVSVVSVSNGCGGGPAGNDSQYGDDSEFVNSEIPFDNVGSWNKAPKYHVNFREACKQHDAGYSHAKVKDMDLNGGKVIDYFHWSKAQVDKKFLDDMIKICNDQVPKTATVALRNCKQNGGFHLVSGAKTRFNLVAATTYTQTVWRGLGFYQAPPRLSGTWTVPGVSTGPWSITQSARLVMVKWTGGSAQPNLSGEFRGTIISHDDDSSVEGFYVITDNGTKRKPRAMKLFWSPKTPASLRTSTGFTLTR
jgi:hypothetical protein